MKCPKCKSENPDSAKFCLECGSAFRKIDYNHTSSFSRPESYTPQHLVDKILTSRSSIEGERKYVTVVFVDVANSTHVFEKIDPEAVHQIMNGCFKILLDEVHKFEGTINQFRGDGVMAIFGAPLAHEDHAQRACHAALGIKRALKDYSEEIEKKHKIRFDVRIGMNTGPVVVGAIGDDLRMDYTADGDTTNLAFRIESNTRPGTILISSNTYRLVGRLFQIKSLGKINVKGKKHPLDVYELIDEKIYRPRIGLERQIYSEMVGRENEIESIELQLKRVIKGEGSVINIIGEAGIGKSRLLAELKDQDLMKQVMLLEGKAISIGKNLSFYPIIDILKQWALIKEEDKKTTAFNKLETAVMDLHPKEANEIIPFIATLMGMKLTGKYAERVRGIEGEALENLVFKNFRELFIQATKLQPIVMIIEDLHWSDLSSIGFLESIFRLAEGHRILFINAIRPAYEETGDRIIKTLKENLKAHYIEVKLTPLDDRSSETLINNMLKIKGLSRIVIDRIVKRSDGNPYFIEEVVRSFIDEGVVVVKDGFFKATSKINALVIPQTISDVLMSRIDRLDEKTKTLITVASVIGRSFFYRILIDIIHPTESIDKKLLFLEEAQLVVERNRIGEREYLFKHALTQEVVYESILYKKRIYLHLQVAASIEHLFNDKLYEFYGVLAYHYGKGENLGKTEEYLIKAGEESLKSSASNEALNCFKEALNLYLKKYGDNADPEKIAMFENNIGLAYYNKGSFFNALEHFDVVLERSGYGSPKGKFRRIFRLIYDMSILIAKLYLPLKQSKRKPTDKDNLIFDVFQKRGIALIYLDTERFFFENISFIRKMTRFDIKQINTGVYSYCSSSGMFSLTGLSFNISNRILNSSKKFITKNAIKELLCYEFYKFFLNEMSGNWFECKEYDENLVNLNLKKGRTWLVATYILLQGLLKIEQGFFAQAELMAEKLNEIWEVYDYQHAKGLRLFLKTILLFKQRKINDAKIVLEKGISFQKEMGEELSLLYYLALKAVIQILQKDQNAARIFLNHAKEIVTSKGRVIPFYLSRYFIGCFLFDLNVLEKAILSKDHSNISKYKKIAFVSAKKALKTAKKYAPDKVEALKLMGTFFWLINKQKKALKYWKESINTGEKMGSFVELSRTYFEVGKRLLEDGSEQKELNGIGAEEYLNKASNIFKDLELEWDLRQFENSNL